MSIQSIDTVIWRIKSATPKSPIAVFQCNIKGHVNAVFADTAHFIAKGQHDPRLIGVFHKKSTNDELERIQ